MYCSTVQNSITADGSLLSPTVSVNTIPLNTEKWLQKSYVKTMATVYTALRTNEMNYSITNTDWNDAYNKQDNMHNKYTNDDVDARNFDGRVAYHNMH